MTKSALMTNTIKAPREGSKQAKLVAMLSRKSGVTLAKASDMLGCYVVERQARDGKDSVYCITAALETT